MKLGYVTLKSSLSVSFSQAHSGKDSRVEKWPGAMTTTLSPCLKLETLLPTRLTMPAHSSEVVALRVSTLPVKTKTSWCEDMQSVNGNERYKRKSMETDLGIEPNRFDVHFHKVRFQFFFALGLRLEDQCIELAHFLDR